MLLKEYRICMPLTVDEYHIGQLYMIAKHSEEQSQKGEGVEVLKNEDCYDPVHGKGRYTEKRIYLSSRLPVWSQRLIARLCSYFYVTEKAWNFYPFTITEYSCSFLDKFSLYILSRYENNCGTSYNCLGLSEEDLKEREVDHVDIVFNEVPEKYYKVEEDLTKFKSKTTDRGPLKPGWKENTTPIMCSYKAIKMKFEVWGLQSKVENFAHRAIRDILVLGHRQAFAWIDEWHGMTLEEVRQIEKKFQSRTNEKVSSGIEHSDSQHSGISNNGDDDDEDNDTFEDALEDLDEMSGASGTSR
ncbi:Cytoplasmic phosphatidylinositol transfer protein 1 [Holothuria leucospilota]|uniref:Cytoplasmic phosphatidylinositol transfer protein 1 n=1 Tax=Holothuria leucospilota TaxID=206669 RepID=A0A9Q1C3B1_HOLLE|nr:Cytoplasmic phosphatidylinositol transfer protein 1 [Holothuria leucospilota]